MSSSSTNPSTNRNTKSSESDDIFHHYPNTPSNPTIRPKHFYLSSDPTNLQNETDFSKINSLLDNICKKTLDQYYPRTSDCLFKKKFDKLNLKFYLETEKYLHDRIKQSHCQSNLFVLLFQQINLCIEEIARLNKLLEQYKSSSEMFLTQTQLVATLKQSNTNLEKRLSDVLQRENKLIIQNEKLTKQINKVVALSNSNNNINEIKENIDMNRIINYKQNVNVSDLKEFYSKCIHIDRIQNKDNKCNDNENSQKEKNSNNKHESNNSFHSIQNASKTIKGNNNYKNSNSNNNNNSNNANTNSYKKRLLNTNYLNKHKC
jgi:hypothetical protein